MADDESKTPEAQKTEQKTESPAPVNSATKSPEDIAKQNDPKTPNPGPVELDHGEVSDEVKAEAEANEKVKQDPWGNTPAQMRDQHDALVDPAQNDPISSGLVTDTRVPPRLDPMEPQSDADAAEAHGVKGGTNAPA
jgi:hypothetical protein